MNIRKKSLQMSPSPLLISLFIFLSPLSASSEGSLPAFPGAEGYGAETIGGRGGRVIEVTTLSDQGPSSLREALMAEGPRIVVFRIGGTIELDSRITLGKEQSYLTLAGQTAPGEGIQIKGWDIVLTQGIHDVVIRYMRFRPGETGVDDWSKDSLGMFGDTEKVSNIIIDHSSLYWGPDEAADSWGRVENITWQWNFIEDIVHDQGGHFEESKGMLVSSPEGQAGGVRNISIHHNYFANNAQRNPSVTGDGPIEIVNNLIYNWRDFGTAINYDGYGVGTRANLIGNFYKRGPESNTHRYAVGIDGGGRNPDGLIYAFDNLGPFREQESLDEWAIVGKGYGDASDYWEVEADPALQKESPWPQSLIPITIHPARAVLSTVLEGAGAVLPVRDSLDERLANDFRYNTGDVKFASKQKTSWWPVLAGAQAASDADHDGMPDDWESKNGFDPEKADGNSDADGDGYTNVEEYLNGTQAQWLSEAPREALPAEPSPEPERKTFWQRLILFLRNFLS